MSIEKSRFQWFKTLSLKHLGNEDLFYIVTWVLVFAMQVTRCYYDYAIGITDRMKWQWVFDDWIGLIPFLLIFSISKWLLEPFFFFRQKIRSFFLLSFLSAFIIMFAYASYSSHNVPLRIRERVEFIERSHGIKLDHPHEEFNRGPLKNLIQGQFVSLFTMSILVMGTSLCISIIFRWRNETLTSKVVEAEKVKTELDYLKYQINPHFFMNTLNNIHALVDIDSQTAKDAIIELSRLMRYMLYETSMPTVPLSKELEFQRHFIELMRLRYDDNLTIVYEEPEGGSSSLNVLVPPLLGVVFVENAFKYGVSHRKPSFITIKYTFEKENYIHFICKNSNFCNEIVEKKACGLGLENVKKRLDLLYSNRYKLNIQSTDKEFSVDLLIPFYNK